MKTTLYTIIFSLSVYLLIELLVKKYTDADHERLLRLEMQVKKSHSKYADSVLRKLIKQKRVPDNSDIDKIETRINRILLLEETRRISGDTTLAIAEPSDIDSTFIKINKARTKAFSEVKGEEKVYWFASWYLAVLPILFAVYVVYFFYNKWIRGGVDHGY